MGVDDVERQVDVEIADRGKQPAQLGGIGDHVLADVDAQQVLDLAWHGLDPVELCGLGQR